MKKSTVFTANHSFRSSPLGSTTAERMLPEPSVALAYSDSLWRLPDEAPCDFSGLNVLFLLLEKRKESSGGERTRREQHGER